MMKALAGKIASCEDNLNVQEVGNALYGLKKIPGSRELCYLVGALSRKVAGCQVPLSTVATSVPHGTTPSPASRGAAAPVSATQAVKWGLSS